MPQIAVHLDWAEQTVRETIRRWQTGGLGGLWEADGRGRHRRWSEEDWQALAQWTQESRRYSAAQLAAKLATERQVQLGKEQVRRILKKTTPGSGSGKVHRPTPRRSPIKRSGATGRCSRRGRSWMLSASSISMSQAVVFSDQVTTLIVPVGSKSA